MGLAVSIVQQIWRAHGLAPYRLRVFKLSRDSQFAAKLRDFVGLNLYPPAYSLMLSADQKSHAWVVLGSQEKDCAEADGLLAVMCPGRMFRRPKIVD